MIIISKSTGSQAEETRVLGAPTKDILAQEETLQEIRDSLLDNPEYDILPGSQLETDSSQEIKEVSVPSKESKRGRMFLYISITIIAAIGIYLLLTLWLLTLLLL